SRISLFISFVPVTKQMITKLCLFFFLVPISAITYSQKITGIWKGYFRTSTGEHYKLEFQVLNNSSYTATGVSYSYLDVRFYGKATMTGSYVKSSKKLRIREIRTVEVKSMMGGITCIMNYDLVYSRSGKEEFLEGTYLGRNENPLKTDSSYWGDCGEGTVFLRKVEESDFYLEPFLRKTAPRSTPPTVKKTDVPKINNPVSRPPVASTKPPATTTRPPVTRPKNNSSSNTTTSRTTSPAKPKIDSAEKSLPVIVKEEPIKKPTLSLPTPNVLKTRENELVKTLIVPDENVVVKIYDNGIIDDDTISVYLDKQLVLSKKRLTAGALIIKLKMDEENPQHELVMVAENLGRIPPNTSLMIVESGDQRFEVRITSTEQKNAMVRFRYQKPQ
ncbi:MAG TPA: hypothetical protein VF476_15530, partial [Chitinophagaceae bacterium]